MRFGRIPIDEAEGAILAHSRRLAARTLKKGHVLSAADVDALRESGLIEVVAARLEDGDVSENEAADRLAAGVAGENVTLSAAFTGRCNLYADQPGVVVYTPERLDAFNLVDEAITLGVVPPFQAVEAGQMIGTLKIIPFGVPGDLVSAASLVARGATPLIRVAPYRATDVVLVQSRLSGTKESVLDSTVEVTRARVEALGARLSNEVRCEHDEQAVAREIGRAIAAGAGLVLVSGASAVVDRRDVIPASIEAAGGEVVHFGMPVDPGNLMLMGHVGDVPVMGMPGCARSPKLNGFDWVLQRHLAGQPVTPREIMRMGPGGLLKDIPSRPLPRAKARRDADGDAGVDEKPVPARAPRIAAIVLAAGQSRRMGSVNKLLASIDGVAMLRRTLDNVLASKVVETVVVTGHERHEVERMLEDLPEEMSVRTVNNPDFAAGLSTSVAAGIAALDEGVDGAIVCLGDMPRVGASIIDRLIAAYDPVEGRAICVPTQDGKRGNPVLWDRRFFPEIAAISGDVGARHLIGAHDDLVVTVEMADQGVLIDVDTPDALARLHGGSTDGNG